MTTQKTTIECVSTEPFDLRQAELDSLLECLQRQYGADVIKRMGDEPNERIDSLPTGSIGLDIAMGYAGYPRGRIIELFGEEGCGKTTLALHAVVAAQQSDGTVIYVDAENAFDPFYATLLGIRTESLIIINPEDGEQAFDLIESLVATGLIDLVIIDSVAALMPRRESSAATGEPPVWLQARLMAQGLRKLNALAAHHRSTTYLLLNQIREIIAEPQSPQHTHTEQSETITTTPGGNTLKFFASIRIELRRRSVIYRNDEPIGISVEATVVKNKLATPFQSCSFDIRFGEGIARSREALQIGIRHGFIEITPESITFDQTLLGKTTDEAVDFIELRPSVKEELTAKAYDSLFATIQALPRKAMIR